MTSLYLLTVLLLISLGASSGHSQTWVMESQDKQIRLVWRKIGTVPMTPQSKTSESQSQSGCSQTYYTSQISLTGQLVKDKLAGYIKTQFDADKRFRLRDEIGNQDLVLTHIKTNITQLRKIAENQYLASAEFVDGLKRNVIVDFILESSPLNGLSVLNDSTSIRKIGNEERYQWQKDRSRIWKKLQVEEKAAKKS